MKHWAAMLSVGVLWILPDVAQSRFVPESKAMVDNPGQKHIVIEDLVIHKKKRDAEKPIVIEDQIIHRAKREAEKPVVIQDVVIFRKKRGYEKPIIIQDDVLMKKKREAELSSTVGIMQNKPKGLITAHKDARAMVIDHIHIKKGRSAENDKEDVILDDIIYWRGKLAAKKEKMLVEEDLCEVKKKRAAKVNQIINRKAMAAAIDGTDRKKRSAMAPRGSSHRLTELLSSREKRGYMWADKK